MNRRTSCPPKTRFSLLSAYTGHPVRFIRLLNMLSTTSLGRFIHLLVRSTLCAQCRTLPSIRSSHRSHRFTPSLYTNSTGKQVIYSNLSLGPMSKSLRLIKPCTLRFRTDLPIYPHSEHPTTGSKRVHQAVIHTNKTHPRTSNSTQS